MAGAEPILLQLASLSVYLVTFDGDTMSICPARVVQTAQSEPHTKTHFKRHFLASTPFMLDELSGHTVREFIVACRRYFEVTDLRFSNLPLCATRFGRMELAFVSCKLARNTLDALSWQYCSLRLDAVRIRSCSCRDSARQRLFCFGPQRAHVRHFRVDVEEVYQGLAITGI
jgi:hypothetical protein